MKWCVYEDTDDSHDDGDGVTKQHHAWDDQGDGKQDDPGQCCRGNADAEEEGFLQTRADGDHAQQRQGDRHKPQRHILTGGQCRQEGKEQACAGGEEQEEEEESYRSNTLLHSTAEHHQHRSTGQQMHHITVYEGITDELVN